MSWMKEYYVSYVKIHKSLPIKLRASTKEEAQDIFRKACAEGKIEEEEITFQINIQEKWKQY